MTESRPSTMSSSASPGTPATGCSSPVTASPRHRDRRQRLLHAAQLPRRDPGAGRHRGRSVQLPAALRRLRHPHPGRSSGRAGGDEPGRAEGQPGRSAPGWADHRRHRRLHAAQPGQGRLRRRPADRRQPGRLPGARPRPVRPGHRRRRRAGPGPQGGRTHQEHVRPRPAGLAVQPSAGGHARRSWSASSRAKPQIATPTSPRFKAGYAFGETTETVHQPIPGGAGSGTRRAPTGRSPATARWPTG